uniref:Uncharacterized protein n=1 Tax=Cacopsylla melanoneura TaxID=428564 RepID=A0A8D8LP15_9HEMI
MDTNTARHQESSRTWTHHVLYTSCVLYTSWTVHIMYGHGHIMYGRPISWYVRENCHNCQNIWHIALTCDSTFSEDYESRTRCYLFILLPNYNLIVPTTYHYFSSKNFYSVVKSQIY